MSHLHGSAFFKISLLSAYSKSFVFPAWYVCYITLGMPQDMPKYVALSPDIN